MSKAYGIEEARPILGDLVTAAQYGQTTILTRNGKPAARIVPVEEPAVSDTYATIRDAVLAAAPAADPDELDGRNQGETAAVVITAMLGAFSDPQFAAAAIGTAGEDYLFRVADDTDRREQAARRFYEELARYAASGLETCARYEAAQRARLET